MSEGELVFVGETPICHIGQYEENQYWMAREANVCGYTYSAQNVFNIDIYRRFRSKEKCRAYIKKQVLKQCKRILTTEQGNNKG